MPRPCTVCQRGDKPVIDAALLRGQPIRAVASECSATPSAIARHKRHMVVPLRQAQVFRAEGEARQVEAVRQVLDVCEQLKAINGASLRVLQEARERGQGALALQAVDRVQRQLELQARLLGQVADAAPDAPGPVRLVVEVVRARG